MFSRNKTNGTARAQRRPRQTFTPTTKSKQRIHELFVNENIWSAMLKMVVPGMVIALMTGLYLFVDQILIIKLIPFDGVHDLAHMPQLQGKFNAAINELNRLEADPAFAGNAAQIEGIKSSMTIESIVRRSIAYSGSLTAMFTAVTLLFSVGTSTRYSLYLGRGDIVRARATFNIGVGLTVGATLLISLIVFFVHREWINFQIDDGSVSNRPSYLADDRSWAIVNAGIQAASQQSVDWASDFVLVLVWFVVVQGLFTTIQFVLRAEGKTAVPMFIAIGTNALNVLLEWLFLGPGKLGIAGGAWATVIGWGVSLISMMVYLFFLLRRQTTIIRMYNVFALFRQPITKEGWKFFFSVVGMISLIGLASFTRNAAASLTGTLQNNSFAYVAGAEAGAYLAAFGSFFPVWLLIFPIFLGIIQGGANVTAYNYGYGNYDRVKQGYWIVIVIGFIYGLFVYLVVNLGLLRYVVQAFELFPGDPQFPIALDMAERWMVNAPFQALTLGAILLYQSTNRPVMSIITSALSGVIVYIPAVFIFREIANFDVWIFIWTTPVTVVVAGVIATLLSWYTMRYSLGKTKRDIAIHQARMAALTAK